MAEITQNLENRISSTQSKDAVFKAHSIKSSASEIDAVANVIDSKLAKIHQLFRQALNGKNNIVYAVVGDSTRSIDTSEWEIFYPKYLSQININYFNNADPSQTVYDWLNNIDQNKISDLISASSGSDGEDTIVEFSMGLNDYTKYGNKQDAKVSIKNGIVAYMTAKPKANLFLVSPNWADNTGRRNALKEIYEELALELDLLLLDGHIPTQSLNLSSDYYIDGTHPNPMGALRILYWIFNSIMPSDVISALAIEEYTQPINKDTLNSPTILNGLYDGNGVFFSNNNYRCLEPFNLGETGIRLNINHGGNRTDVFFFNSSNTLLQKMFFTSNSGYVYPPAGAVSARVNITTSGTSWDSLGIAPTLKYHVLNKYFTFKELTNWNKNKLFCSDKKYGIFVDGYSNIGKIGQTLTIDSNNKMKWS